MLGFPEIPVDPYQPTPLYQQVVDRLTSLIQNRTLPPGARLPATRELAGDLGVNRATISAAYASLEQLGLIHSQVGRGSFVASENSNPPEPFRLRKSPSDDSSISFSNSRPATRDFPLAQFRRLAKDVIDGPAALDILQLGSSRGYGPLRRFLLQDPAAEPQDDLLVTNGCQQALDLIARVFSGPGAKIAVEDPVYHGMLRAFARSGASVVGVPLDDHGIDVTALERVFENQNPSLLAVTPSFQNPTGLTIPLERRHRILALAERCGCLVIEIDIYSLLRYTGEPLPTLKSLRGGADVLLLRSYSKVAFPGLRVGWMLGAKHHIARLAEAKEISDIHSDQLSQAVLLRFAESGELDEHLSRTREAGRDRLRAIFTACQEHLPPGSRWTRPEGGMNLWVELPAPFDAQLLLARAQEHGVTFLPGRHFGTGDTHPRSLRLSFGGLTPAEITRGLRILGECAVAPAPDTEPLPALV